MVLFIWRDYKNNNFLLLIIIVMLSISPPQKLFSKPMSLWEFGKDRLLLLSCLPLCYFYLQTQWHDLFLSSWDLVKQVFKKKIVLWQHFNLCIANKKHKSLYLAFANDIKSVSCGSLLNDVRSFSVVCLRKANDRRWKGRIENMRLVRVMD